MRTHFKWTSSQGVEMHFDFQRMKVLYQGHYTPYNLIIKDGVLWLARGAGSFPHEVQQAYQNWVFEKHVLKD